VIPPVDLKDHRQDHHILLMLNRPILEVVELVLVHVQRNHLEEGDQAEVDFHPSLSSSEEETRIGTKKGTHVEYGL
jgi:hypothetical protein